MSESATLSAKGLTGGKNTNLVRHLLRNYKRTLGVNLLAINRACEQDALASIFQPFFKELRALPPEDFWPVWFTPAAAFWTHLASEILKTRLSGQPSVVVDHYASWLSRDRDQAAIDHFKQLGVLVVAAHLRRGAACALPIAVPLEETGSFPGAGVSWQMQGLELLGCTSRGEIRVREAGTERSEGVENALRGSAGFFRTPLVSGRGKLWVDAWSTCMRADYEGLERCPRVTGYSQVLATAERLATARARIEAYSQGLANELAEFVSAVALLEPGHIDGYPSGSSSFYPGAVFVTNAQDPDMLAELLLHECGHTKLFLLQREELLLDAEVHGNGWEKAAYYSPWRDALRPLQGILHGLFVFTEVAGYWHWRLAEGTGGRMGKTAERRLKTLCEQLKLAQEVLRANGTFTTAGQEVMADLSCRLDALAESAARIDGDQTEVMHAEVHATDAYRGLPVNEAIRRHRADHWPKAMSAS